MDRFVFTRSSSERAGTEDAKVFLSPPGEMAHLRT